MKFQHHVKISGKLKIGKVPGVRLDEGECETPLKSKETLTTT